MLKFKKIKIKYNCTFVIVVITVQNSQENNNKKEMGELNLGINNYYTLQQTNAMLKILNVVINVSLKHTVHTSSLP